MKIKAGKYYRNRYGEKVGPITDHPVCGLTVHNGFLFHEDGRLYEDRNSVYDLIAPWEEPEAKKLPGQLKLKEAHPLMMIDTERLTKRERFAMAAMQAIASRETESGTLQTDCKYAVMYADALLAELERTAK